MTISWTTHYQVQTDRFTSDGVTDTFHLTHQPFQTYTFMLNGVRKRIGVVGSHFFFQGYDALVNEQAYTLNFAVPPVSTGKQDNIELVYTYDPTVPVAPSGPTLLGHPTGLSATAATKGGTKEVRRREVRGWEEWDYLDYADFENAMRANEPITYALCQWFIRQAYGNPEDPFTESEWDEWYQYAQEHCPRFAKERSRRYVSSL